MARYIICLKEVLYTVSKIINTIKVKWLHKSYSGAPVHYRDDIAMLYQMIQTYLF